MNLKHLICFFIGHKTGEMQQDGKGAAWYRCPRCNTITSTYSHQGGRPWLWDK